MDLHDFSGTKMYFEEDIPKAASLLLSLASKEYAEDKTEAYLLKAYFSAPTSFTVIVALYRYYFYEHQFENALIAAHKAMQLAANRLELTLNWQQLNLTALGYAVMRSMEMVRFYLLALKGAGYLNLRAGNLEEGVHMLEKVKELDEQDRLGAASLLKTMRHYWQASDGSEKYAEASSY